MQGTAYLERLKAEKNNLDLVRTNGTSVDVFHTTDDSQLTPSYGRWFMGRDEHGINIIRKRRAGISPAVSELPWTNRFYSIGTVSKLNKTFDYNSTANSFRNRGDGSIITRP